MRRPQLNALLIGGLIAALLAGIGLSHWMNSAPTAPPLTGLVLNPPREIPDFALQTQTGAVYDKASIAGRWQLMFFGFTHCPDICPSTLALMRQLKLDLPESVRQRLDFVLVSVDPARDTAPVLKDYLAHFDPTFIGVRTDDAELEAFTSSVGAAYIKVGDDAQYSIDHSTAFVLLDDRARVRAYFSAPHSLPELQRALSTLIAGS